MRVGFLRLCGYGDIDIIREERIRFPKREKFPGRKPAVVPLAHGIGVFREGIRKVQVLFIIARDDRIVGIARDLNKHNDWYSLRQPLL